MRVRLLCLLLLCMGCSSSDHLTPNILLIVADDTGWNDVGYHNPEILTPNIDQLAAEGVQLDNFYVYPTCSPTRAALLTGRYASRFGITHPIAMRSTQVLPAGVVTLPGMLREQGYSTAIAGKWHLGLDPQNGPLQYGFDHSHGFLHGQIDQYTHRYKNGDRSWHRMDQFMDQDGHATDLITEEAITFITSVRDKSRPFFLYLPYSVPHYPVQESDQWLAPYEEANMPASRKLYAASMTHLDHAVGQLISKLEALDLRSNTLVIFMSDNGGQLDWTPTFEYEMRHGPYAKLGDNLPLRGSKTEVYEGGIRVPALLNWPGTLTPGKVTGMVKVTDIFATLAGRAGTGLDPGMKLDGDDIWSGITGNHQLKDRELFLRTNKSIMYRQGDWKLIHHGADLDSAKRELYNIIADPFEETDLIDVQPEIYQELWTQLVEQVRREDAGQKP